MKRLYFDTETTGFPKSPGTPLEKCPRIVQLAAILIGDDGHEMASINLIIKPEGWTIPDDVAAIHGITTEMALSFGVPIKSVMSVFSNLCRAADQIVAHNITFDLKLVAYEFERIAVGNVTEEKLKYCTMEATTDICKLPGKYGTYKWPKLTEAHAHLFGVAFDDAHDALADVRACQRVHAKLIETVPHLTS